MDAIVAYSSLVYEQVEISLLCTLNLIGSIWKCWNLLFQFCPVIGFHCLGGPGFRSRSVSPSSDQCQISPHHMNQFIMYRSWELRKWSAKIKVLMFKQVLPTYTQHNVWWPVRRIWILMLGLKGLKSNVQGTVYIEKGHILISITISTSFYSSSFHKGVKNTATYSLKTMLTAVYVNKRSVNLKYTCSTKVTILFSLAITYKLSGFTVHVYVYSKYVFHKWNNHIWHAGDKWRIDPHR